MDACHSLIGEQGGALSPQLFAIVIIPPDTYSVVVIAPSHPCQAAFNSCQLLSYRASFASCFYLEHMLGGAPHSKRGTGRPLPGRPNPILVSHITREDLGFFIGRPEAHGGAPG